MRAVCSVAAITLIAAPAHAADDAETARLNQEAKSLFATALKGLVDSKSFHVGPCTFDSEWSRRGLGYDNAHKALGLEVHADLQNPDDVARPSEIFGTGLPKEAFCDEPARNRYIEARVAAWQSAFKARPKDAKPPKGFSGFSVTTHSFSFPFFDRSFQRAVVIWEYAYRPMAFDEKGERRPTMGEGRGTADVYQRDATGWRNTDTYQLYRAN